MRIVDEIAEALFPINANMRQYNSETTAVREAQRKAAIPIITAKLKPIKEALSMMWEDLDMPASEMIEKYEAARAKFEDE